MLTITSHWTKQRKRESNFIHPALPWCSAIKDQLVRLIKTYNRLYQATGVQSYDSRFLHPPTAGHIMKKCSQRRMGEKRTCQSSNYKGRGTGVPATPSLVIHPSGYCFIRCWEPGHPTTHPTAIQGFPQPPCLDLSMRSLPLCAWPGWGEHSDTQLWRTLDPGGRIWHIHLLHSVSPHTHLINLNRWLHWPVRWFFFSVFLSEALVSLSWSESGQMSTCMLSRNLSIWDHHSF